MIIDKARELGIAISQSNEYARLQIAQSAMEANEALLAVLNEYQDKQNRLISLLREEDNPDKLLIASLSRDVDALQAQLMQNTIFSALVEAQNVFSDLMASINKEIGLCIGVTTNNNGCGGSCSGCEGCKH